VSCPPLRPPVPARSSTRHVNASALAHTSSAPAAGRRGRRPWLALGVSAPLNHRCFVQVSPRGTALSAGAPPHGRDCPRSPSQGREPTWARHACLHGAAPWRLLGRAEAAGQQQRARFRRTAGAASSSRPQLNGGHPSRFSDVFGFCFFFSVFTVFFKNKSQNAQYLSFRTN
jgi:hypothetical protein